jgi:hypothetical protein
MTGAHIDALHDDAVFIGQRPENGSGFALVFTGNHLDGVTFADAHLDALNGLGF